MCRKEMKKSNSSRLLFLGVSLLLFLLVSCDDYTKSMTVIGFPDVADGYNTVIGPFDAFIDVNLLTISPSGGSWNLKVKRLDDKGAFLEMTSSAALSKPGGGNWISNTDSGGTLISYSSMDFSASYSTGEIEFNLPDTNTLAFTKEKILVSGTLTEGTSDMGIIFGYVDHEEEYYFHYYREDGIMKLALHHEPASARSISGTSSSSVNVVRSILADCPDAVLYY